MSAPTRTFEVFSFLSFRQAETALAKSTIFVQSHTNQTTMKTVDL